MGIRRNRERKGRLPARGRLFGTVNEQRDGGRADRQVNPPLFHKNGIRALHAIFKHHPDVALRPLLAEQDGRHRRLKLLPRTDGAERLPHFRERLRKVVDAPGPVGVRHNKIGQLKRHLIVIFYDHLQRYFFASINKRRPHHFKRNALR